MSSRRIRTFHVVDDNEKSVIHLQCRPTAKQSIFLRSSSREQSNKRSGARLKKVRDWGETLFFLGLARFGRETLRLGRDTFFLGLARFGRETLKLRKTDFEKKTRLFCSLLAVL